MLEAFCVPARAAPSERARSWHCVHCHKWLCAPKGAGFLYARREVQPLLEPLVVSWGWKPEKTNLLSLDASAPRFVREQEWQGTLDPAAYLAVPAAIKFQTDHDWPRVQAYCHKLLREARQRIEELTGLPPTCPNSSEWYAQMAAFPLPVCDGVAVQRRLYGEHRVEVPIIEWNGRRFVRVSVQGYNTAEDVEVLLNGLSALLPS